MSEISEGGMSDSQALEEQRDTRQASCCRATQKPWFAGRPANGPLPEAPLCPTPDSP